MAIDPDIKSFVDEIGAKEPSSSSESYAEWRTIFRRSNYFLLNGMVMIVKISRSEKPFWGVGKNFIDLLNSSEDYYLVLLISPREGWVFDKQEVNANISSKRWNLREKDNNYKINYPLPDRNSFFSPKNFLKKVGVENGSYAT